MTRAQPAAAGAAQVDLDDMQGLLRFGYRHHVESCFLLLRIRDAGAARAWLAAAPVSSAQTVEPPPPTALQVALTCAGLRALGVDAVVVESFAPEFVAGLGGDPSRSRRLGDVGADAPQRWQWGVGEREPHALLMLHALPGRLVALRSGVEAGCAAGFETLASLTTADLQGFEPFGFRDGISQPEPDWQRRRPARDEERRDYDNLCCLGEFVLGYPNEYGAYTERPLLDPRQDAAAASLLPRAEDAPDRADLGRNGSYLVMRQLEQDVAGFWRYLDGQAAGDAAERLRLAAAMVGRTVDGRPLAVAGTAGTTAGAPGVDLNAFDYQRDPDGLRCPLGAHVRRTNPRNADLPPGAPGPVARLVRRLGFDAQALSHDLVASTRFHRLLRRGREYGPRLSMDEALAGHADGVGVGVGGGGDAKRGLHFVCLNASIARQFEFVQGAWAMNARFDGLRGESDALLGNRLPAPDSAPTDGYSMPRADGPDRRLAGLPRFVTVLGGAYFFLPGLRALRYLAAAPQRRGTSP